MDEDGAPQAPETAPLPVRNWTATTDGAGPPAGTDQPTVLVHYAGETPISKAGITWHPDQAQRVPEPLARTLIGSDHLRLVSDEELFTAVRARRGNLTP